MFFFYSITARIEKEGLTIQVKFTNYVKNDIIVDREETILLFIPGMGVKRNFRRPQPRSVGERNLIMNEYASLSNSVLKEADKRFMEHMNRLCKKPGKFLLRIEELVKVTGLPAVYLWTFVSDRHKFTTFNCLMVRSFELHPETIVLEIEVV